MSQTEYHIGKATLVLRPEGMSSEDHARDMCEQLGVVRKSFHDSFMEALLEDTKYFYHRLTDKLYYIDDKDINDEEDIIHAHKVYDTNEVEYSIKFYNGGASFYECLEEAMNRMEGPYLKINFHTGTAFCNSITVPGTMRDDLISLIEEYIDINGDDWLAKYTYKELYDDVYQEGMNDEEIEEAIAENFFTTNGGAYYIYNISSVEEINN